MTKLTNAPPQPKMVISLRTLGPRKHTVTEARDSTFILENSMLGDKSPYSTSNIESSTTLWLGSSLGSSQEVTLFNLLEKLISYDIHVGHDDGDYYC